MDYVVWENSIPQEGVIGYVLIVVESSEPRDWLGGIYEGDGNKSE